MNLKEAREFAENHAECLNQNERILIMRKGSHFIVTEDYKAWRDKGYALYESIYNL
jgi:hypothetical protein